MAKAKVSKAKELVKELKELYLRDDTEMAGRGLYHRALSVIYQMGGHVDKDTEQISRIKDIILELEKVV